MTKTHDKVIEKDQVYYFKEGWKQKIGDVTKVYLKGTDYERGLQLGKLLSKEVKIAVNSVLTYNISKRIEGFFFLKYIMKKALFLIKLFLFLRDRKKVEKTIKKYPAWIVKMIEGIGHGSGVNPFFLKFIGMPEEHDILGDDPFDYQEIKSCCSFAFTGKDGNIYHGKNLDWVKVEEHIGLISFQQHEDENGNSFSIIGVPGILGGYEFGMNSHGISIGLTGRFHRGKTAAKLAFTNALELSVLRYGKNLKQIQSMYNTKTGFDRTDGLLISSVEDGDYQLFEVNPMGAAVTSSKNGVNWTVNTYLNPKLQKYNKNWGTVYDKEFCDPRYKRLQTLLFQNPQTREDAFNILSDTLQPGFECKTFLGQTSINRFITHASVLMVRGKQGEAEGVWIAKAKTYAASHEYVFFDFSSIPCKAHKKRPPNPIVKNEAFKNFKDFMKVRESRYTVYRRKLLADAEKLLEKEPENPIFILFFAQNLTWYKHPEKALAVLENHPLPWCADYWYCLGQCYRQMNKIEEAKTSFTKAMTLPSIDGFAEAVRMVCLVQLVKVNTFLNLTQEVNRLQEEIKEMQTKFATQNIGMPDYPYLNNIIEQMEEVVM